MRADAQTTPIEAPTTTGRALFHTCPIHPFERDGECGDACPTFCGASGPLVGPAQYRNESTPDDCVVCDALFDAAYGRSA